MYIHIEELNMGDLRKKKVEYFARTEDGDEILLNEEEISTDDQTIEQLREYIKQFAAQQKKKAKGKKDGQI